MRLRRWFAVQRSQVWAAKMAALFFVAGGLLFLATMPLSPVSDQSGLRAAIAIGACAVGVVTWFVPWERFRRPATLVLVPVAFGLIAGGNLYAGRDLYFTYGVFYVIAFAWIGLAHPPFTPVAFLPLAALAYVAPIPTLPEADRGAAAVSALFALPISVLTGEILARGIRRQVHVEAELRRARVIADELRALEAMRDRFLRAASHEFRTPIAICRGHLEVLGEHPTEQEVRETVALVTDELDRMTGLLEDLSASARLDDPRAIHVEPIDVPELLQVVGTKARPLFRRPLVVDAPTDGKVMADRQRLTQALLALLDNAATHAFDAARVELRASPEDRGRWRFAVFDDGQGIDVRDGDPFEPFHHRPGSPGSGLGLSIVRAIAEAHGGSAGLRRDRSGTEFYLEVPA